MAPAEHPPVRLSHVTLVYDGGVRALDDVSLEVSRGERICVLGANGSGKSTLASVVCGLLAPDEGTVELAGERVCADGRPDLEAYRRARRSLGLVFQNPDDQIVTSVVEDDVAFGPENLGLPRDEIAARVARELRRVAMEGYAGADPSRLSGGQRQRVCIAGALAMEPAVLVLDEPGSLLDVRGRAAIMRVMGRLAAAGTTLIHVTHFMEEALDADRVLVMDHGRILLEGTPDEVFSHGPELSGLGLEVPFAARLSERLDLPWTCDERQLLCELGTVPNLHKTLMEERPDIKHVCKLGTVPNLQVEHVTFSYGRGERALDDVSFEVPAGSSTAIIGQTGSGKSTLLRLLCGLERPDEGRVVVDGHDTSSRRGSKAARRAVGYVMQHPERQLFAETVEKDVAFGPRNLKLPAAEVERRVSRAIETVGLTARRNDSPFTLSGGQRRLCALAGILAMEPRILVLDEPTAGLDPRGRAMLRRVLARLSEQGITLVQVTHSMEDAARSERVIALDQSRLVAIGTPREVFSRDNERRLREGGLGIPRSLRVARELEDRGWPPLGDPLTTDELVAAIRARAERAKVTVPFAREGRC
ncbi:ABC transporter ATP-binding protein [Thermophilibacter provencensis]|uniref:ATP-binding cassette domain-containing protein n=1 Tax=Thermophilibacter provencensis TaxID=1852386 RepID=A0A921GEC0_9ACTN|nr:energy-coupling factor transporter ATPase [Thermophilibacter provencensis]HJF44279.1 ATP-binding cassette domain-containing protein [Thermophilibacter provencensis]